MSYTESLDMSYARFVMCPTLGACDYLMGSASDETSSWAFLPLKMQRRMKSMTKHTMKKSTTPRSACHEMAMEIGSLFTTRVSTRLKMKYRTAALHANIADFFISQKLFSKVFNHVFCHLVEVVRWFPVPLGAGAAVVHLVWP